MIYRDEDPTFFSVNPDPAHFKLEFVDSGFYFVQDENSFINSLLQVGSESGSNEKITGSGSGGPKINRSDRILNPAINLNYRMFVSYDVDLQQL